MHAATYPTIEEMKSKRQNVKTSEVRAAAAALGRLGGIARRKATTKAQRSADARKAANTRWGNLKIRSKGGR